MRSKFFLIVNRKHLSWVVEQQKLGICVKLSYVFVKLNVFLKIVEEIMADDDDLLA